MTRILHIDDDIELGRMLSTYLQGEGFEADHVNTPEKGLEQLQNQTYDLLILDVMMPTQSGLDTLATLRKSLQIPVLMLTAKGDDVDRIVGLELGADDYVPKPCNPREIVARIRAILRRTLQAPTTTQPEQLGELELNTARRQTTLAGKTIDLTSAEFNVLEVLVKHQGQVVSKNDLSEQGLGRPLARYDRSVDVHISSIRNKLGLADGPNHGMALHTIRGQGYQLGPA
ncbi:MAG: response regulator transcription factor [Limnobacter sp.]|nr:response regulator transcription factor [Limnobacter sp.]